MKPSIEALHHTYTTAKRGPLDVLEEISAKVLAPDAPAHVFTALTLDRAKRLAQASEARWRAGQSLGVLDGIPIVWKDAFDMAGTVTTCGSPVRQHAVAASHDAALVSQLENLGMISIGKTTLSEFAYSGLGINPFPGTPRNPADPRVDRIPGGSSSGSAAAVTLGWVPCGMGTDTSGSIRVPAALQGLVGFKPSHGRYASQGIFPLAPSMDTAGPLVRSVADACLLDVALKGQSIDHAVAIQEWIFVVPSGRALAQAQAEVSAVFDSVIHALTQAGARVVERDFAPFELTRDVFEQHGTLVAVEATKVHEALMASPEFSKVDVRISARMRKGAALPKADQEVIQNRRASLMDMTHAALSSKEVLLYPTVAMTAPEIAPLEQDENWFAECNLRVLHNTMLASYLNMPTLHVPAGLASNGLPAGVSLSMPAEQDALLLGLGLAVERVLAN